MLSIWKGKSLWIGGLFLAAMLPVQAAAPATPGTINYIEGQVRLEGRALTSKSAGSATLEPNQVLSTDHGKAEVLLTPGVFLRVGDNTSVRMVSPELTNTQVELLDGEAMVEATEVLRGNDITVIDHGAVTRLEKNGLYDFKAAPAEIAVYDGKASVLSGDRNVTLKKGKELLLAADLKPHSFDRKAEDPLYAWSSLRSEYAAEASVGAAQTIVVDGGWWGAGWYWNPWWDMYSFIPGAGYLYSPFGWGFYSPGFAYYAPMYRGFRGYPGHGFAGHAPVTGRGVSPGFGHGGFGGARSFGNGSFGGARSFGGGGFHGGGFHGGGRGR